MHIGFITAEYPKPGFPHGGIGTFIKNIAHSLANKNVRVTVFSNGYSYEDEVMEDGSLTVYYLKKSQWPVLKFIDISRKTNNIIAKVHQQHPIDVIESQENGFSFINKIPGVKFLIRMHGGHHYFTEAENRPTEWRKVRNEKVSFSKADALVAVSNYTNIRTAHFLGYNPANTTIIPNGIDVSKFLPGKETAIVPHRIVFAGTVCEKKGIRQLVMALPAVKKRFPDAELVVLGNLKVIDRKTGGLYMDYLKTYIDPSVTNSINFVGFVDSVNLQKWVHSAEICVYPSHMEALPFAWVEVLAMQKLLIGGKTGPGPEVIEDGKTGLLCDPHDPADIAEKIIYAFENPEVSKQIGLNARQSAIEKFDTNKLHEDNLRYYESLIATK
jgi:glycosyltransferase involved in cell wall biosynthesis